MAPMNQVNKDFLRDVFADRKKLFKKSQVTYISVPNFDELSVKNLWAGLKDDDAFKIYFNDIYPKERFPERSYFFNILNTIYPDYLSSIMSHACKTRFTVDGDKMKREAIVATDEWYNLL